MSFPDLLPHLSPAARRDFADILQYTFENWGENQMLAYRGILLKDLSLIVHNPGIGHFHPSLSDEFKVFGTGRHLIVYQKRSGVAHVARILGGSMDIGKHLEDE
ncbi:MAG TPA: type II toxin-antitoxin system RelE/ParE family toxin [Alphaproteobacteria bacterium]|nr:type II toxin-antitoxin system RelE/ParE family toxin [Alphaproteobacteria bacterium]